MSTLVSIQYVLMIEIDRLLTESVTGRLFIIAYFEERQAHNTLYKFQRYNFEKRYRSFYHLSTAQCPLPRDVYFFGTFIAPAGRKNPFAPPLKKKPNPPLLRHHFDNFKHLFCIIDKICPNYSQSTRLTIKLPK